MKTANPILKPIDFAILDSMGEGTFSINTLSQEQEVTTRTVYNHLDKLNKILSLVTYSDLGQFKIQTYKNLVKYLLDALEVLQSPWELDIPITEKLEIHRQSIKLSKDIFNLLKKNNIKILTMPTVELPVMEIMPEK